MEFSMQEYWNGQAFPSPGDLPNPGIEPGFPALKAASLPFEPPGKPRTLGQASKPALPQGKWDINTSFPSKGLE